MAARSSEPRRTLQNPSRTQLDCFQKGSLMSLRTRLIIAFLLLSVVPLSLVTLFSYVSSVHAFELAAQHEATESATDVSRRMEMITSDVGRRMDRLFGAGAGAVGGTINPDPQAVRQSVAPMLGDTASLVDR